MTFLAINKRTDTLGDAASKQDRSSRHVTSQGPLSRCSTSNLTMYVNIHNIMGRSIAEEKRITYSECVSVALAIRHAEPVRRMMWPLFTQWATNGRIFRLKIMEQ